MKDTEKSSRDWCHTAQETERERATICLWLGRIVYAMPFNYSISLLPAFWQINFICVTFCAKLRSIQPIGIWFKCDHVFQTEFSYHKWIFDAFFLCLPQFAIISLFSHSLRLPLFWAASLFILFHVQVFMVFTQCAVKQFKCIPECEIHAYVLLLPLLAYVDFVYFYYYSLIQPAIAAATIFLYISTSPLSSSPVSFFYFGCSVWFDNVFYIISISWRGHHVLLVATKDGMNGPISMLEALPIKR